MSARGRPAGHPKRSPIVLLSEKLIARNYQEIGCDAWEKRRVLLLCAKLGDTPEVLGARMRLAPAEFQRRMASDIWTKQDGLILTMLEREIEQLRGGRPLPGQLVSTAPLP